MNIRSLLSQRMEQALADCGTPGQALVQTAARPEFGDYQANGVMGAAKKAGRNPRELAAEVVAAINVDGIAETPEVAGPGFLNFRLLPEFLAQHVSLTAQIEPTSAPQTIVVDYSAPNLAKEMHVGHLRSTIIGDAICRVLEALGHRVIRQNHVGDWGTQFGMLLTYMQDVGANSQELADLETFYVAAKGRFDSDADFADRSRAAVVGLQAGDPDARAAWQRFIDISLNHCQEVYDTLGTSLTRDDVMAESAYNDQLADIIQTLEDKQLLTESDGARCVFLDEFKGKKGEPQPVIVQKSDGGYLYATTDLAAIQHRSDTLAADRVLYFVDVRQSLHFRQVFSVARHAGFARDDIVLEHLPFGAMLGKDGKPFKTREGGVIKLANLLDEAKVRARAVIDEKNADLSDTEKGEVAEAVGIGAVKYADLSKNRTSDYVFDWEQMLSFDGNTAPYLQYACARIRSIFRRAARQPEDCTATMVSDDDNERSLAVALARLQEVTEQVAQDGFPHQLCGYLFDVATKFSHFYEHCPILKAEDDVRERRLAFCAATLSTLETGLDLLGINTPQRM